MPELEWGEHLVDSLFEFGPCQQGTMGGFSSVTFVEMESWSRMTKTSIPGYETVLLKKLSQDYANQYMRSQDSQCPMPTEEAEETRNIVGESFRSLVKAHRK